MVYYVTFLTHGPQTCGQLIFRQDPLFILEFMQSSKSGYYHVWISSIEDQSFFLRSLDKAYFISLLRSALSPHDRLQQHSLSADTLAIEIDLLAYSLTETGVHLLVYTIRKQALHELGQRLQTRYAEYIQNQPMFNMLPFETIFIFDKLLGPHEALNISREIHLLHDDWRYDRYSSIGFYLDDRRGDWIRLWRLARLYENQPSQYLDYLKSPETETDKIFAFIQT
jgi:hypothetical protein